MIKKNLFVSIILIFSFFVNPLNLIVFAQEPNEELSTTTLQGQNVPLTNEEQRDLFDEDRPPEIQDTSELRAEFKQHTQNPASKSIRFEMVLRSNINSDRVRINWKVTGVSSVPDETQLTRVLRVRQGETYTIPLDIIPLSQGITEIFGTAQAFGVENRVIATVRKNFASNQSGEILPITEEYNQRKTINTILNVAKFIGIIVLIVGGIFVVIKLIAKWYNTDEREQFDKRNY